MGPALAIALRVSDHFGGAKVVVAAMAVHALDV
jgi:hypothetical protein